MNEKLKILLLDFLQAISTHYELGQDDQAKFIVRFHVDKDGPWICEPRLKVEYKGLKDRS